MAMEAMGTEMAMEAMGTEMVMEARETEMAMEATGTETAMEANETEKMVMAILEENEENSNKTLLYASVQRKLESEPKPTYVYCTVYYERNKDLDGTETLFRICFTYIQQKKT